MNLADCITVADAAEQLNVKYHTLLKRIHTRGVKFERIGKRVMLIHKEDVKRLEGSSK